MPNTFEPIATASPTNAATSYTFTSIPQTFTDLVLVMNVVTTSSSASVAFRPNSDSGSNYTYQALAGSTTSFNGFAGGPTTTGAYLNYYAEADTTNKHSAVVNIMNYANTTTYKNFMCLSQNQGLGIDYVLSTWRSTSAITSLEVRAVSSSFSSNTIMTLYGIKAAAV